MFAKLVLAALCQLPTPFDSLSFVIHSHALHQRFLALSLTRSTCLPLFLLLLFLQGRTITDLLHALKRNYVRSQDPQHDGANDPWALKWDRLASTARRWLRPAPGMHCMFGPMDAQAKVGCRRQGSSGP